MKWALVRRRWKNILRGEVELASNLLGNWRTKVFVVSVLWLLYWSAE
jgi:hypothetical protein